MGDPAKALEALWAIMDSSTPVDIFVCSVYSVLQAFEMQQAARFCDTLQMSRGLDSRCLPTSIVHMTGTA